jgi:hypothetical protein
MNMKKNWLVAYISRTIRQTSTVCSGNRCELLPHIPETGVLDLLTGMKMNG